MVIYEDRVTVCGVEVWRDCGQPDLREALLLMAQKEGGGYVRISGPRLMKALNRDASNPIGRPIKSFCDNARERLREARNLDCGRYDIIDGKGGYHFTPWMSVQAADSRTQNETGLADEPAREPGEPPLGVHEPDEPRIAPLNERQSWILEQVDKGVQLRHRDIVRHTGRNRSTVNRDLKGIRERGMIRSHPDGYYVRT